MDGLEHGILPQKKRRRKKLLQRKRLIRSHADVLAPAYVWPVDMHQQQRKYNSLLDTQNKVMAHLLHVLSRARLSGNSSAADQGLCCDYVAGLLDRGNRPQFLEDDIRRVFTITDTKYLNDVVYVASKTNTLGKIWTDVLLERFSRSAQRWVSQSLHVLPPSFYSFSERDVVDFRKIHEKDTGVVITSPKFGNLVVFEPCAHFAKWLPCNFNSFAFSSWLLLNARKLAHLNKKERRSNIKYPLLAIHLGVWGKPQSAANLGLPANACPKQIYPAFTKESLQKGANLRQPKFNKIALEIMENDQFLDFVKAVDNLIDAIAPIEGVKGRFLMKKCKEIYDIESPIGSSIFMTIAINCSPISKMQAHMDFSDDYSSFAVVVCLASVPFIGGDLVFWQLKTRIHFDAMDVLVFRSRLFVHGNTDFTVEGLSRKQFKNATEAELKSEKVGGRGSIVFFSGSGILHGEIVLSNQIFVLNHFIQKQQSRKGAVLQTRHL
ncbi:hypothetical protein HDU78_004403 [Chytriomyces hyalinus]|nr:hypothetical protein HDU78_004403 [Chytriomyces hyalinus]